MTEQDRLAAIIQAQSSLITVLQTVLASSAGLVFSHALHIPDKNAKKVCELRERIAYLKSTPASIIRE